jgi:antitoxin HigA-1
MYGDTVRNGKLKGMICALSDFTIKKGLLQLYTEDNPKDVSASHLDKVRKLLLKGDRTMTMKNPPHPGDFIRTEIIDALGLSVSKAAAILKVRRATLSDLLAGKASLSPEMALHIEKAFGPDMDHLLRMQLAYDVAQTRSHAKKLSIKRYVAV